MNTAADEHAVDIFNLQVTKSSSEIHGRKTKQSSGSCRVVELLLTTSQNLVSTCLAVPPSPAVDRLNTHCSKQSRQNADAYSRLKVQGNTPLQLQHKTGAAVNYKSEVCMNNAVEK